VMQIRRAVAVAILCLAAALTGPLAASAAGPSGKADYQKYCAGCHGADGKGNGEAVRVLAGLAPADLTLLSRKNGGVFPAADVRRVIDGRDDVAGHHLGERRMPLWGLAFREEEGGSAAIVDPLKSDPSAEARAGRRIDALVEYLKMIQAK
jgi:mono/diheme cytochrome c family protein